MKLDRVGYNIAMRLEELLIIYKLSSFECNKVFQTYYIVKMNLEANENFSLYQMDFIIVNLSLSLFSNSGSL